jgi:hypothetical protein
MKLLQRLLFLLFAANFLLLLWSLLRPTTDDPVSQASNNTANTHTSLVHVSELSNSLLLIRADIHSQAAQTTGAESGLRDESSQDPCLMLGPFVSEESARIAMTGEKIVFEVVSRREEEQGAVLYRAMIRPTASRETGLVSLSSAREAIQRIGGGIDTYLVASGPIANAVSLGLFSERSNALNVQRLLAGEGIVVVIEPEIRAETRFWVVTYDAKVIDMREGNEYLQGMEVVLAGLSENLCEMIAQAEQFP